MPKRPTQSAKPSIEPNASLKELQAAAKNCQACDLWKHATQTVFGEGPSNAKIILVGEQPGNQEDLEGKPFVGPAGKLLDEALAEAGIDRKQAYVTNAVKHFKWEPRGKRRIHKKPNAAEMAACRPWLDAEIAALHPKVIVCLGATAAQSLLGRDFRVTQHRGVRHNLVFRRITDEHIKRHSPNLRNRSGIYNLARALLRTHHFTYQLRSRNAEIISLVASNLPALSQQNSEHPSFNSRTGSNNNPTNLHWGMPRVARKVGQPAVPR